MLNTSRVSFGVLTANSFVPSGDIATGRTCPLSNSTKEGDVVAAVASSCGGATLCTGLFEEVEAGVTRSARAAATPNPNTHFLSFNRVEWSCMSVTSCLGWARWTVDRNEALETSCFPRLRNLVWYEG